jgi:hypothetical protein
MEVLMGKNIELKGDSIAMFDYPSVMETVVK